ncbi:DinB family protein [Emticicia fontis]
MNQIELLTRQTESAYAWADKLIETIPDEQWDTIPEVIESSITWQVGHLVISYYYHTIMVTVGHQVDILQQIPIKEYSQLFHNTASHLSVGKTKPEDLKKHLKLMAQKSISIIQSLNPINLEQPLVPTPMPHPIAKTKFEAIDWNIKHTMWHCGQLGMLKRIVHERYDFGLR